MHPPPGVSPEAAAATIPPALRRRKSPRSISIMLYVLPRSLWPGGREPMCAVAGILWTVVSPAAGLLFAATLMAAALVCLAWNARERAPA